MFKKVLIGAAASASALVALPMAANAQYYGRGYDPYYGRSYDPYYRGGYAQGGYYTRGYDPYYANRGYSARSYNNYDGYYGRRCGSGTTGAIVGGAAGALVGREIARGGRSYYGRRGEGTVGSVIGGVVGALIGREVGRSC